jgi:hypothetical protein
MSQEDLFVLCGLDEGDFQDVQDIHDEPQNIQKPTREIHIEATQPKLNKIHAKQERKHKVKKAPFRKKLRGIHLCESQTILIGSDHTVVLNVDSAEKVALQKHHEAVALFSNMEKLDCSTDNAQDIGLGLATALDALGRRNEALAALSRARKKSMNNTKLALRQVLF